jgi:hypothetical protein
VNKSLFIIIAVVTVFVIYRLVIFLHYRKSTYFAITKKSLFSLDEGSLGEYRVYTKLKAFERSGGRLLFNLYVPKGDCGTTEIDAFLIHPKGIFVIESKNYSGWIFGSEADQYWTQTLPVSRGRVAPKSRFYNPIRQNASHILALKRICDLLDPVWSVVVFSNRSQFKSLSVAENKGYRVVRLEDLNSSISELMGQSTRTLSVAEIDRLYGFLYPFSQSGQRIKEAHNSAVAGRKIR